MTPMPDKRRPWFPMYPLDFLADRIVQAMKPLEPGCYCILLLHAWNETPPGTLPNRDAVLADMLHITVKRWRKMKRRVMAPWTLGADDRWHQKRMQAEAVKADSLSEKRRQLAARRWANHAKALPLQNGQNAKAMPSQHSTSHHSTKGGAFAPAGAPGPVPIGQVAAQALEEGKP